MNTATASSGQAAAEVGGPGRWLLRSPARLWCGYVSGPLMLLSWSVEPKFKKEIILLMLNSPNPHLSLPWSPRARRELASKGLEHAPDF